MWERLLGSECVWETLFVVVVVVVVVGVGHSLIVVGLPPTH